MANEEVLGPRKTMFILVIVVGCFAMLWPRILGPLILGHTKDQLKPNKFDRETAMKQERPSIRAGQHPALRERGRAIPPSSPSPVRTVSMPPHVRVRSPLSVYYELDIKPPPIPGMRPPLGSPGGPVPAAKSSMGFVMPIYTICIIVFFVYTLSKILFKRTGSPYEAVNADPQFRRRVFREDSRTTPDKLVVTAISGLVAEVQQQMEANYGQNQQRQDAQETSVTRPYTNGTILHNTGPVHIVASEYRERSKEKSPEPRKNHLKSKEVLIEEDELAQNIENTLKLIESLDDSNESTVELEEIKPVDTEPNDSSTTLNGLISASQEFHSKLNQVSLEEENNDFQTELVKPGDIAEEEGTDDCKLLSASEEKESDNVSEHEEINNKEDDLIKPSDSSEDDSDVAKLTEYFIQEESNRIAEEKQGKPSTPEILEDAIREDTSEQNTDNEQENASVKVMGMEVTAHSADGRAWMQPELPVPPPHQPSQQRPHEAEEVKSIFLDTEIPQKSKVLVTDFVENRPEAPKPANNSPMVVSGKMTLSLIQDASRDTPERDLESTVDDFTTASAVTQPAIEKAEEESEEEIEEEIEVEEIEVEEIEEDEIDEDEEIEPVRGNKEPSINESTVKGNKENLQ